MEHFNQINAPDVFSSFIAASIFAALGFMSRSIYKNYRMTSIILKSIDLDFSNGLSSKRKLDTIREKLYSSAFRSSLDATLMLIMAISCLIIMYSIKNYALFANYNKFGSYFFANYVKYFFSIACTFSIINFVFSYKIAVKSFRAIYYLYDDYARKLK